ncbi:MAG: hypothetical protein KGM98_00770 [Bacteroidota bacterium]|nr:hypothetical protein [Bacteroidota bacterium]
MIGLFINPQAGKGKALQVLSEVTSILNRDGIPFVAHNGNWPASLEGCTEAWILGGDGTLNYFLNRYPNPGIPLVPLGGGTGDDFSWSLYGKTTTSQRVSRVLQSPVRPVDAARCNQRIFLNIVGIGFDGAVLESLGETRKSRGHLTYLTHVIRKIFTFKEMSFEIRTGVAGYTLEGPHLLVSIANGQRTGGGFLVAPEARLDDGLLDLTLCEPLSRMKRLRYLPVIEKGKHLQLPFITHLRVPEVTITAVQEVAAQIDGELFYSRVFEITVLPGYMKMRY